MPLTQTVTGRERHLCLCGGVFFMAQYDGSIRINTKINTKEASAQLMSLENRISKTAKEISSLRSRMDSLKNTKIPTQEYTNLQKEISVTEKKLLSLYDRQERFLSTGGKEGSQAYKKMVYDAETLEKKLQYSEQAMQNLVNTGKAFTLGSDTEEYTNLGQRLQYLENNYSTLIQRRNEFLQRNNIQETGYERLQASLEELKGKMIGIMHPAESMKSAFSSAAESIKEKAAGIAASIINGINHPFQTMKKVATSAISGVSKLLSGMSSIANKVGDFLKGIASKLLGIGKNAKSASSGISSMGTGFKNMIKNALGISSLYALFSKLRSAIKEGFRNLAQYSAPVNAALSSLKSSLTQLKNSLATAFAPILTAIAPALTTLINMVSKAATAVGMLIAALTGQKTFTKAKGVQEDYAASLGKTANAAKKAVKALAGFDKLNVLNNNDSDDSDAGGGGVGAGIGDMFETVDIPSKISDLAKMIKDAWEKADFTEIGALIGTKLKNALEKIPWEKIQAAAAKVGKSLATLINGFVEVDKLGYTIGKTIGEAINTGIIGINAFLDNTHWDSVGKFIGEGLNGVVNTIDWKGLGHLFAAKFNAIFETIGEAARTFKWTNFGKNLASSINKFISDFDWSGNGAHLSELIKGLLDSLIALLEETNWQELGEKAADFIGAIDWTGIAERIEGGIGAAIGGLAALIWGFIKDAWQTVVDWWYDNAFEDGKFTISGLLNGILEAITGVGDWLYEHVYLPFKEGFESAFGSHEISEITNNEMELAKEGAITIWEAANTDLFTKFTLLKEGAKTTFEEMKNNILTRWELVKVGTSVSWENIKENLLQKWELVKVGAKTVFEKIKESILQKWELVKTGTLAIWNGIKNGIKSPINAIIGYINKMISGIVSGINAMTSALNSISFSVPDWVPGIGGSSFGLNIPQITAPQIPKLADGAVIRGGDPFMAVLGDQPHGQTNIETPLPTMLKAFKQALAESGSMGGGDISVKVFLGEKDITNAVKTEADLYFKRTGKGLFAY